MASNTLYNCANGRSCLFSCVNKYVRWLHMCNTQQCASSCLNHVAAIHLKAWHIEFALSQVALKEPNSSWHLTYWILKLKLKVYSGHYDKITLKQEDLTQWRSQSALGHPSLEKKKEKRKRKKKEREREKKRRKKEKK